VCELVFYFCSACLGFEMCDEVSGQVREGGADEKLQ
jgi:hypothetical protein